MPETSQVPMLGGAICPPPFLSLRRVASSTHTCYNLWPAEVLIRKNIDDSWNKDMLLKIVAERQRAALSATLFPINSSIFQEKRMKMTKTMTAMIPPLTNALFVYVVSEFCKQTFCQQTFELTFLFQNLKRTKTSEDYHVCIYSTCLAWISG